MTPTPLRALKILILALLFSCVHPDASRAPSALADPSVAGGFDRFAAVKEWEIRFDYSASNPYQWEGKGPNRGELHNRSVWDEHMSGTVIVGTRQGEPGGSRIDYVGTAAVQGSYAKVYDYRGPSRTERTTTEGQGRPVITGHLTFFPDTGTYDLSILGGGVPVSVLIERKDSGHRAETIGPYVEEATFTQPLWTKGMSPLQLPTQGMTLEGSLSTEDYWAAKKAREPNKDWDRLPILSRVSGRLRWIAVPHDPLDVELVVEARDYETWMPEGGPDEKTAGNFIDVKATLVAKDGGRLPEEAASISFELEDVSTEPGVALNLPWVGATNSPDLLFDPARQPMAGLVVSADGRKAATPDGAWSEATARVSAYDWGAYGKLRVKALLKSGREVIGHLKGAPTETNLLLPKRAPDSRIADRWKELSDFPAGKDTEDADRHEGEALSRNQNAGDGLTAYEEYRGLVLKGKHTRALLKPRVKDLVVITAMGDGALGGLQMLAQAAGIHVIAASPDDLPPTRLLNVNRGSASGGEQHALRLADGILSEGVNGENRPKTVHNKTPRLSTEVVVDLSQLRSNYLAQAEVMRRARLPMPYSLEQEIAVTIAHELAHGIGAGHHGLPSVYDGATEITERMTRSWKLFDELGAPIPIAADQPFKVQGLIGRPGNEASGDANCLMAYTNQYNWAALGPPGGPYSLYKIPLQPLGTKLCASERATGSNLPHAAPGGQQVPGFFGNARGDGHAPSAGNCLSAIRVKDWN